MLEVDAGTAKAAGYSGCWVLADGLGGHLGGAVAARLAVEGVLESFAANPAVSAEALEAHAAHANRAVLQRQESEPDIASMRTTVVFLTASSEAAMWAHCGDSRLYWFRDGRLRAQTRDHSVPGSLAAAGEIAPEQIRFHADRSRLRRSLGGKTEAQVTIGSIDHPIQSGDAYLLSSDGFWEWVTEPEMEADLTASAGADDWLQRMQFRLRERASADHDNYSAIAVLVTNGGGHLTPEHSV